jgi:putative hydrolase of the HAD superfamily
MKPLVPPRFIYFDMGGVLLRFSHRRAAQQMAEVAGLPFELVWQVVFEERLELEHEAGQIDDEGFCEAFCQRTNSRPDPRALLLAGSDIFELNASIVPVVTQLAASGWRTGVLSNTSPPHWAWVTSGRFGILPGGFRAFALSYELKALKPDPTIYRRAAELAGVAPEEVFFVDDHAENVAAAREAGFDAVLYSTAAALAAELRRRGVSFNY